jgi:hypothetical protein
MYSSFSMPFPSRGVRGQSANDADKVDAEAAAVVIALAFPGVSFHWQAIVGESLCRHVY